MPTRLRKKRYALLACLLGIYGVAFVSIVFKEGRDVEGAGPRAVDAHAENITCTRNWFVLGATWNCRATVVTPDGKRYPYSSFASAMTPDDIGHPVEMARTDVKGEGRYFTPTRPRSGTTPVYVLGFIGSALLAIGGPILLWPRGRKRPPEAVSPPDQLARARTLRTWSWIATAMLVAVPVVGFGAFQLLSLPAAKWVFFPLPLIFVACVVAGPELRKKARRYEGEAARPAGEASRG